MRRRQAFAAQTAAREAALAAIVQNQFAPGPLTYGTPGSATVEIIDPNACPKCGKVVTRGKFMHQKHCKGIAT